MQNNKDQKLDTTTDISLVPGSLPIRGEHRIVPIQGASVIQSLPDGQDLTDLTPEDFSATFSARTQTDYLTIKINGRTDDNGNDLVFRFTINPESLNIARDVLDAQALTRAGWQIGVWGDNFTRITGKCTTAGQYFGRSGLTDYLQEFTVSYRNLIAFVTLFENNGYWFEGEQVTDGPLTPDYNRKRIKMHSDVIFQVDNFIWHGMFQSVSITESSEQPYLATFSFDFIAWKERFKDESPWGSIEGLRSEGYHGHSYEAYKESLDIKLSPIQNVPTSNNVSYSNIPDIQPVTVLEDNNGNPIKTQPTQGNFTATAQQLPLQAATENVLRGNS